MVSDDITKMVVLADSSPILPSELALKAYELSTDATVKETCFGLIVTGSKKSVNDLIKELRTLDPVGIFVKDRGFPPGDSRRCRAVRGGGPRPGFHQLEKESHVLPSISYGLERIDDPLETEETKKPERLKIARFLQIIEEQSKEDANG
ncbi:MAG TPA: methanogenesis marker 6 protein [Candidatus Bathyarchaeia archaeon]|jgi:putative methanogenesis marker protein 6|nr:methanogenesis marker 6 protein [Candidatus Bathyarchaeia archaeon]HYB59147.1 methanogenesis marker 6 protein [Candidatus Acidoferrales bacterium]